MDKAIRILAVIAVIQLVLTAITWVSGSHLASQPVKTTLLDFDRDKIDQIVIKGDGKQVSLKKADGQWQTADHFPADQRKVDKLLDKLESLQTGFPVAISHSALKRFKVDKNDYERHVQLKTADKVIGELFLGTGAGAGQSHARRGNGKEIYSVAIGSYAVSANSDDWQDKTLLQIAENRITAIELDDLVVQRDNTKSEDNADSIWKASNLPDNKQLDSKAINDSLSRLSSLRFASLLGQSAKPEYGLNNPVWQLSITHKDGQRRYQLGKLQDSQDYVLKVSDRDDYFKIASYVGEPLINAISRQKWIIDKPAEIAADQADSDSGSTTGEEK